MSGGSSSDDRQDSDHRPELRIRERALALLERDPRAAAPTDLRELDELVAELQVHQVELGLQNEELRAAQRLTEELRARYYDLFERAPVGYVLMDGRGEVSEANRAAAALLGLSGRTGSGRRLGFYVARADRARFNRFLQDALATDAPQRCELTLQPEDLPEVRVLLDGAREPGPEAALARCRVALIDVSARAAAEEALRVSEERFRLSFDRALIGKALAAPDGRLTQVNAALCQLFGTERVELEAQRLEELAHPDLRAVCRAWLERLVSDERTPSRQELRFLRRDGQVLWVDTCIAVERDPEGRPRHLIADFVDLTENRRLRASLADPDHLATLGLLAAGVAHEINNPLSYVLYNLESAVAELPRLAAEAPEELLERLEQASEGAGRVRKIARSLSAFARVEKRELSAVELRAPLEAAVDMASAELKCRAHLVRELGEVPRVLASEGKLAQVFLNLLVNAAQAIPEGDAERNEIRVRTWQEGAEVCVEIRDTGQGLSDAAMEHLFRPFFSTKPQGQGMGLGLAMSRSIVQALGGRIEGRNVPGSGAAFVVRLPVATAEVALAPAAHVAAKPVAARPVAAKPAAPAPRAGKARMLIVDDEPLVRSVLRRILEPHHEVVELGSGADAKRLLANDRAFDLIWCDVTMPNVSGQELYEWLAARDPQAAERVVFVTGGTFTSRAHAFLAQVPNPKLEKPFDVQTVRELVATLLERRTT